MDSRDLLISDPPGRTIMCFHWEPSTGCSPEEIEVARAGFEPATFHFSGERCYQLSYLAKSSGDPRDGSTTAFATPTGLEPATSAVTGRRANQLRYGALPAQAHPSGRPRNYSAGVGWARNDIIRWPEVRPLGTL